MVRFACAGRMAAVLIVLGAAVPVGAQEIGAPAPVGDTPVLELAAPPPSLEPSAPRQAERPAALVPLYVSFAVLQGLDAHSTSESIGRGAVEANPLMKGLAGHRVGLVAIKAAGTAGVIYASERMWKRSKPAAVIFMIAANSAMAWVVQHNYRIAR
jgi:hypothetical protein